MLQVLNQKKKKRFVLKIVFVNTLVCFLIALSKTNFEVIKEFLQYQEMFCLFCSYKNKIVMSSQVIKNKIFSTQSFRSWEI